MESAELAPRTPETLRLLRARPATPRDPLPEDILGHVPDVEFQLDSDRFKRNVRSAKRGAAGGPSGMTMEHLRVLLDSPRDTQSLFVVSELLARGAVPNSIRDIVRIGRGRLRKSVRQWKQQRHHSNMRSRRKHGASVLHTQCRPSRNSTQMPPFYPLMVWEFSTSRFLGTPLGHTDYMQNHLERVADEHQRFMDMLPSVPNLLSSWSGRTTCCALCAQTVCGCLPRHTTEACGSVCARC